MDITIGQWIIIVYVLMSCAMMDIIKPQNDPESPVVQCLICFVLGGALLAIGIVYGIIILLAKIFGIIK